MWFEDHHLNESTPKKDIISNCCLFYLMQKELNKYLFKEIKKWRKADPEGEKTNSGFAGTVNRHGQTKRVSTSYR